MVEYYDDPKKFVKNAINTDTLVQQPLNLSEEEKEYLVAFMHSLTDSSFTEDQKK